MIKRTTPRKLCLSTKMPFGKYKDKSLYEILQIDKEYALWICSVWEGEVHPKVVHIVKEIKSNMLKKC